LFDKLSYSKTCLNVNNICQNAFRLVLLDHMSKELEQKIDEVLSRGVADVLPTKEDLRKLLLSDKKIKIYIGADATGPQLHIGHATNFMLLEKFRQLGHEVIVLFGDFTAMIGDPTDKSAARVKLSEEQVEKNIETWKSQVEKIVDFKDEKNPAKIVRNSQWLSKLNFTDLIGIASNFTVQRMLERDMFEKRIKENKPIYVHEFFYPFMQGYDSVHLDVDLEIGGTDQTFNMLAGRTLQKAFNNREKFVLSTTLLVNPKTGKKLMSKSDGNFIALNDSPNDMFGKTMALADETIIQVFIDCTFISIDEIKKKERMLKSQEINPRDLKLELAYELVKIYHGEAEAEKAKEYFINTFSKKEIPENIREHKVEWCESLNSYQNIIDFIFSAGLAKSKSDARRKIEQNGVSIAGEGTIGVRILTKDDDGKVLKVGKKDFIKIKF